MTTHSHSVTVASSDVRLAPARNTTSPTPSLAGAQFNTRVQAREFVDNFRKGQIGKLWHLGKNTQEIARLVELRECDVYERLSAYMDARALLKAGATPSPCKKKITLPILSFMEAPDA